MGGFCNDEEGWGPLAVETSDFTLCAQAWLFIFPVSLITLLYGINAILKLRTKINSESCNQDNLENGERTWKSIVKAETIVTLIITVSILCALIASLINGLSNWMILSLTCEFIAWVCYFFFTVWFLLYITFDSHHIFGMH